MEDIAAILQNIGYHPPAMTLRDYFAAHAPPVPDGWGYSTQSSALRQASWAYTYADEMLRQREVNNGQ